jgi:tetratricopeptide (TPR) repeat protein
VTGNANAGKQDSQAGKVGTGAPVSAKVGNGKPAGQVVNSSGGRANQKTGERAINAKSSGPKSSAVSSNEPRSPNRSQQKNTSAKAANVGQSGKTRVKNNANLASSPAGSRPSNAVNIRSGTAKNQANVGQVSKQNWNNLHNNWNRHCANNYRHNWYRGCSNGFRPWFNPFVGIGLGYGGFGYGGWGYGGRGYGYGGYGFSPWGFNLLAYRWGYAPYYNPYCASYSYPYNYSQPVIINYSATPSSVVEPAVTNDLDEAHNAFRAGDYAAAIDGADRAIKASPDDPAAHELRALALFALGRYDEAAAGLNSLLAVAPGWNWDTMRDLYPDVATYTAQLRALEAFARENPDNAAANFVLGYHYLVTNFTDAARRKLQRVVELEPKDRVAAQLLKGLDDKAAPPATSADAAPTDAETDLAGSWSAKQGDARLQLTLADDGTFTWIAPAGKEERTITGKYTLAGNVLVLEAESGDTMVAKVTALEDDKFHFRFVGGPGDDPGLDFERAKTDVAKPPAPPEPPVPPEPAVPDEGGKDF